MNRLDEAAIRYNTDKSSLYHRFTEYYDNWLKKYYNPTILEIGILDGNSIHMWNEYYKGKCTIYCVDIEDKSDILNNMDNVRFFQMDQGNWGQWDMFLRDTEGIQFDFILDDGSHFHEHQLLTLFKIYKKLKPGGVYILEDLHTSFWSEWLKFPWGMSSSPLMFLNFLSEVPSVMNKYKDYANEFIKDVKDIIIYNLRKKTDFYSGDNYPDESHKRSVTGILTFNN